MADRILPMLGGGATVRSDAVRNRELLLDAARRLVDHRGVAGVTMEAVAAEAGVGKGTVFRRFESRAGLMAALLDHTETAWQGAVISGPPPLGPGAPPLDRLLAFGDSRIRLSLQHAELLEAATSAFGRSYAAHAFTAIHVRYLLGELRIEGDLPLLATALLAPVEVAILDQQVRIEGFDVERIIAAWIDLVRRVVGSPA